MKAFKKIIRALLIAILLLLVGLFTVVFVFEDEAIAVFVRHSQHYLKTEVKVKSLNLTLWKHFPDVALEMEDAVVFDAIEGSTDTLLVAENISLSFNIADLLRKNYTIDALFIENARLNIKVDENGHNNYNILKEKKSDSPEPVSFNLSKIVFNKVRVHYIDQQIINNHLMYVRDAEASLVIQPDSLVIGLVGNMAVDHISLDKINYVENKEVAIDAGMTFGFKDRFLHFQPSKVEIGKSNFDLSGSIRTGEISELDLKISAKKGDVQTLVALLPNQYVSALDKLQTSGNVYLDVTLKGAMGDDIAPSVNVDFGFENAEFFHDGSDQRITQANLKGRYSNGENRTALTSFLELSNVKGNIKGNPFVADFKLQNFKDPFINLSLSGKFDILSVLELFPTEEIKPKSGTLTASNVEISGRLNDFQDASRLNKINSKGKLVLRDFEFQLKDSQLPFTDFEGDFLFNQKDLGIIGLRGNVGSSDFAISGFFKDFFSHLLNRDERLLVQGDFKSTFIDLDELLKSQDTLAINGEKQAYSFSISPNIDFDIDCHVERLKFRELKGLNAGKKLKGSLKLRRQVVTYRKVSFGVAGGTLSIYGSLNAQSNERIVVNNHGRLDNIQIDRAFIIMQNFGQAFITDKNFKGELSGKFHNHLVFNEKLELDLNSLKTEVSEFVVEDGQLLDFGPMLEIESWLDANGLKRYLKKSDLSTINFSRLENTILIKEKQIVIPSMTIKSDAASDITVSGTHTFSQQMDYTLNFPLINYQRQERHDRLGIDQPEGKKHLYIYMDIVGHVDDYEIKSDNKAILQSGKEKVVEDIRQTFSNDGPKDDYFGIDTEDTTNIIEYFD